MRFGSGRREGSSRRIQITKVSPEFLRVLKQMLGLDQAASDGDILMAVQEVLEQAAKNDRMVDIDVVSANGRSGEITTSDFEDESRVEKIRARVRQLNNEFGDEITPLAMFDLIMGEFAEQISRGD